MQTVFFNGLFNLVVIIHVKLMPGDNHVQVRTFLPCFAQGGAGANAERLGLIAGSDADRGFCINCDHGRRLPAKMGLDLLLYRSEVGIHVQKEPIDLFRGLRCARHEKANITRIENKKQMTLEIIRRDQGLSKAKAAYFSALAINAETSFFNSASDESWIYIMCPAP